MSRSRSQTQPAAEATTQPAGERSVQLVWADGHLGPAPEAEAKALIAAGQALRIATDRDRRLAGVA